MSDDESPGKGHAPKSPGGATKKLGVFVGIVVLIIVVAFTKGVMKSILHNAPAHQQATANAFDDTQPDQLYARITNAFFECLLAEEPGAMNDAAAQAIALDCRRRNPDIRGPAEAKPSHLFGYDTPTACMAIKAKSTPSEEAAKMIWAACRALY